MRGAGLAVLAAALAALWLLPPVSIAVGAVLSAFFVAVIVTTGASLAGRVTAMRRVPAFFWREYKEYAMASVAQLGVAGVGLAMLWVYPAMSTAARLVQSAVLALLGLASSSWTIAITFWLMDRGRPVPPPRESDAWRDHAVVEMRDQDGSRIAFPDRGSAADWVEVMKPEDVVTFLSRDGGQLRIVASPGNRFSARCSAAGSTLAEAAALDEEALHRIVVLYLAGDARGSVEMIRSNDGGTVPVAGSS